MNPTARMGIGLIGDIPAGAVMAQALAGAGHALVGRSAPPEDRADHVEALLPGVPVLTPTDIARRSEMVILAADGDALDHLATTLAEDGVIQPGQIVVHVAADGALAQLTPLMSKGAIGLRLIPLLPLTGHSLDIKRLRGGWCAVVAHAPVSPIGQALAVEMGMEALVVDPEGEPALHQALQVARGGAQEFIDSALVGLLEVGLESAPRALAAMLHAEIDQAVRDASSGSDAELLGGADELEALLGSEAFDSPEGERE